MAALRAYLNRPVLFKWVIAAYVGLILAFAYTQHTGHRADVAIRAESHTRTEQLCNIVISVHNNARLRVRSDLDELHSSTRLYRLSDNPKVKLILKLRVEAARSRVRVGRAGVIATHVPPVCIDITGRKTSDSIPDSIPKTPGAQK